MQGPVSTARRAPDGVPHDVVDLVGRDRVPESSSLGRGREHDPADAAVGQDERPARVAGPDQRLQLEDQSLDLAPAVDVPPDRLDRPPDGRAAGVERPTLRVAEHRPGRAALERLGGERERAAPASAGPRGRRGRGRGRTAPSGRLQGAARGRTHLGIVHAGHDVRVRHDVAVGRDEARTLLDHVARRPDHLDGARGGRLDRGRASDWVGGSHGFGRQRRDAREHVGEAEPVEETADLREQRRGLRQRGVEGAHDRRAPDLGRDARERPVREVERDEPDREQRGDHRDGRAAHRVRRAEPGSRRGRGRGRPGTSRRRCRRAASASSTRTAMPARAFGPSAMPATNGASSAPTTRPTSSPPNPNACNVNPRR